MGLRWMLCKCQCRKETLKFILPHPAIEMGVKVLFGKLLQHLLLLPLSQAGVLILFEILPQIFPK
jgi:hypothetical protein